MFVSFKAPLVISATAVLIFSVSLFGAYYATNNDLMCTMQRASQRFVKVTVDRFSTATKNNLGRDAWVAVKKPA